MVFKYLTSKSKAEDCDDDEACEAQNIAAQQPFIIPHLDESLENKGVAVLLNRDQGLNSPSYCTKLILDLASSTKEDIFLFINSNGGDLDEFFGLNEAILFAKSQKKNVYTIAMGICASAAAYVLQVGTERIATKNAIIMIHEVSYSSEGNTTQHEEQLKQIEKVERIALKTWATKMDMTIKELKELMRKKDLFYSAQEAKKLGLIDKII